MNHDEVRMVVVQAGDSLHFWPWEEVASVTSEFRNRLQVVHRDGRVAHRPTACGLGTPYFAARWMQPVAGGWRDPAGFVWPISGPSPDLPQVDEPPVEGLPVQRSQIFMLESAGEGRCVWRTDVGDFAWAMGPQRAAQAMPELIRVRGGRFLAPRRLREIGHDYQYFYLRLDNGFEHRFFKGREAVMAPRFGLNDLIHLEPRCPALYGRYQLRDWPWELATSPGQRLKSLFTDPRVLIGHLIWQRLRYRQLGLVREWATSPRSFWYEVVAPALHRTGFPLSDSTRVRRSSRAEKLYLTMFHVMDYFIEDGQLFRPHEFGFDDPKPEARLLGDRRPEVLVVVEKQSCERLGRQLAAEFGLSLIALNGTPSHFASERLARQLQTVTDRPIVPLGYVDYDPDGYIIARAQAKQLRQSGLQVEEPRFLVVPHHFSPQEIELNALPCRTPTKTHRTKLLQWMAEGGGIAGLPMGIHADHLQPYERLRQAYLGLHLP